MLTFKFLIGISEEVFKHPPGDPLALNDDLMTRVVQFWLAVIMKTGCAVALSTYPNQSNDET